MLQQISPYFLGVSSWTVNFIDRNDHRHIGRLSVSNGFDGLRHNCVICRYYQDHDIGDLCATRPHRCKCRMAWCVQKCQQIAILFDLISSYVLSDPASFTRYNPRISDCIQNRSFTMIDMAHHGDDWSTWLQIIRVINHLINNIFNIRVRYTDHFVAKFFNNQLGGILVNTLVLGNHHTHFHQRLHNIGHTFCHPISKFLDHNAIRHLYVTHNFFTLNSTAHSFLPCTFLLTLH